ncbi:MAG: heavy-metal-associated domain-containing protein [Clostridia bacterium]|nr:heavy-metal-associated domain-containing protein [Oscillospiraceae bacterium]MBQ9734137.1 heavy-metal-associated domain-containing protein [Clostridia bacterium]
MVKVIMEVEGMHCQMCENRVNNAVKAIVAPQSISSSAKDNRTEFVASEAPDEAAVRAAVEDMGFSVKAYTVEAYKKGFSLFKRK